MVNRFSINGVTYTAKPFDFDLVCELETFGVSISTFSKMGMSLLRAYFAICADLDKEDSAKEIQEHLIKGGNLDDISNAMAKEMDASDFFRALANRKQEDEDENPATSEDEKPKRGRKPIEK